MDWTNCGMHSSLPRKFPAIRGDVSLNWSRATVRSKLAFNSGLPSARTRLPGKADSAATADKFTLEMPCSALQKHPSTGLPEDMKDSGHVFVEKEVPGGALSFVPGAASFLPVAARAEIYYPSPS